MRTDFTLGSGIDYLPVFLFFFRQLLHVGQAIRWIGPMYVYAQWGMEGACGILTSVVKSRVSANRHIELNLLLTEQKHALGFVLDWKYADFNDEEDADGKHISHRGICQGTQKQSDQKPPRACL